MSHILSTFGIFVIKSRVRIEVQTSGGMFCIKAVEGIKNILPRDAQTQTSGGMNQISGGMFLSQSRRGE